MVFRMFVDNEWLPRCGFHISRHKCRSWSLEGSHSPGRQKNVRKTSGKTRQTPQIKNNLAIKVLILTNTTTCLDIDKKWCVVHNLCSRLPGFLQNINFNEKIKERQQIFYKTRENDQFLFLHSPPPFSKLSLWSMEISHLVYKRFPTLVHL